MEKSKNRFTFKIVFSYLLLLVLAGIAGYYIYSEIGTYITTEKTEKEDAKLLKTSALITQLYEAESLSKIALQSKSTNDFNTYLAKIDSTYTDIEHLKGVTNSEYQNQLLDSLTLLLKKKVDNYKTLRRLKTRDQTKQAIDKALDEFDQLEESLGVITPEGIAPNIHELSPKAQQVIRDVAKYLNENVPEDTNNEKAIKADSILKVSRELLKEVQKENSLNESSLALKETAFNKTDIELSQQLRTIISSFEQEILINSINENIKKETALNRSVRLAIIAALLGFLVVGIFIFILNKDFWKASLYRKKLEQEKKYSEALLKSREQLIGTVSHDLRTPINAIIGYTHLLEDSKVTESQLRYLRQIKSASDYVNNLVNDLLDFSQLEAGKMTPEKTAFSLYELLLEIVDDFKSTQEKKALKTEVNIDAELHKPIVNDPLRIRQIVSNLLGNAYKFTDQGKIGLKAVLDQKRKNVKIVVSDTGIGISLHEQQQIFNEFTQIKDTDLKKYGGYGLGLTISKKLTELLGGNINLKSDLGQGSTFILELPVKFTKEKKLKDSKEVQNIPLKDFEILIIDDDASFLQMLGEMLESEDIKTHRYPGLHQIDEDVPLTYDVVLTDIEMPQATGFDVVRSFKTGAFRNYSGQPIIAMTGRRDMKKSQFTKHGFSDFLIKPFTKNELLRTIKVLKPGREMEEDSSTETGKDNGKNLFDLIHLKTFLGDDEESVRDILRTFQKDTSANLQELERAFKDKDREKLGKTAHRMLPMFRQLKIMACIADLEKMEKNEKKEGLEELEAALYTLKNNVLTLLEQLVKASI